MRIKSNHEQQNALRDHDESSGHNVLVQNSGHQVTLTPLPSAFAPRRPRRGHSAITA